MMDRRDTSFRLTGLTSAVLTAIFETSNCIEREQTLGGAQARLTIMRDRIARDVDAAISDILQFEQKKRDPGGPAFKSSKG